MDAGKCNYKIITCFNISTVKQNEIPYTYNAYYCKEGFCCNNIYGCKQIEIEHFSEITNSYISTTMLKTYSSNNLKSAVMHIDLSQFGNIKWQPYHLGNNNNLFQSINMSNNNIVSILPVSWYIDTGLRELDLANNKITHIDRQALYKGQKLTMLNLTKNNIKVISFAALQHCTALIELDISNQNITTIGEYSLLNLASLVKINLTGNYIEVIEREAFEYSKTLTMLDLSYQRIRSVGKYAFYGLDSLIILDLSINNLTSVGDWHVLTKNLLTLNISGNCITSIGQLMDTRFNPNFIPKLDVSNQCVHPVGKIMLSEIYNQPTTDLSKKNIIKILQHYSKRDNTLNITLDKMGNCIDILRDKAFSADFKLSTLRVSQYRLRSLSSLTGT